MPLQVPLRRRHDLTLPPTPRYRFAVDALGTVISPITIMVMFIFRSEYEIAALYKIRDTDLQFFMLFSIVMIPALWVAHIAQQHERAMGHHAAWS